MLADIKTIMAKEMKEIFAQGPKFRGGWVGMAIFIGVFSVMLPLQSGAAWVESPVSLVYWVWIPFLLVTSVVADSFAGERERHTLETLLASRLSDRAILFGKIAAAMMYGWGISLAGVILSLVTVNLAAGEGSLLLYPAPIAIGIILVTFLVALMASGLGILTSLRAPTVRQAQQTLGVIGFVPLLPLLIFPLLPAPLQAGIVSFLQNTELAVVAMIVLALLLAVDVALIALALSRFQRAKLILD